MINIILILIALAVMLSLVVAAMQPANFRITRTGTVAAPASVIFPYINNLQKWEAWSPWAKLDPTAKNSFEGSSEGVGAKMSWAGNNKVGVGSMTITGSSPSDFIQFKLEFQKPMKATNMAEFTFKPEGDHTIVTWTMAGTNNFIAKVMGLIINCDKMVSGQFEQGLADLKVLVEEANKK
ncbi:SRPBCC family protein [Methyloglobulus sp.]|uniref:SRPBCC family protein n=1 Tax=Methyloglobulus sp. TaxID=2518622 RepID=UPI0032B7F455